jgi:hypothetical protein
MHLPRGKQTEKLVRIVQAIDRGQAPLSVKSLHVFGSYARGALHPGDLDLIVIHEPIPKAMLDKWCAYYAEDEFYDELEALRKATNRCMAGLRKLIRKPGEKIDILFGTDLEQRLSGLLGRDTARLIWSVDDRDWKSKLNAILPDPTATTAPRDHLLSLKRLNTERNTMELLVDAIRHDELTLTRLPIASLNTKLKRESAEYLERSLEGGNIGKSLENSYHWFLLGFSPVGSASVMLIRMNWGFGAKAGRT